MEIPEPPTGYRIVTHGIADLQNYQRRDTYVLVYVNGGWRQARVRYRNAKSADLTYRLDDEPIGSRSVFGQESKRLPIARIAVPEQEG